MYRLMPNSIIVVEDNLDDIAILSRQLKKADVLKYVKFITDGAEADTYLTEVVAKGQADTLIAIFLDLQLPTFGGLELFRRIRRMKAIKGIPVVVITSSNSEKDLDECQKLSVAKYINKPVSFDRFLQAVAVVLPGLKADPLQSIHSKIE